MTKLPSRIATVAPTAREETAAVSCLEFGAGAAGRAGGQKVDSIACLLEVSLEFLQSPEGIFGIPYRFQQLALFKIELSRFSAISSCLFQLLLHLISFMRQSISVLASFGQTPLDVQLREFIRLQRPHHPSVGVAATMKPGLAAHVQFRGGLQDRRVREHSGNECRPPDRSGDPLDTVEGERRDTYEVDGAGRRRIRWIADTRERVMRWFARNGRMENDGPVGCSRDCLYQRCDALADYRANGGLDFEDLKTDLDL